MNMYILDEGWAGGFAVLAKDINAAMDIIIANEQYPVEDVESYKKELAPRIKRMPVAEGMVYHFMGDS